MTTMNQYLSTNRRFKLSWLRNKKLVLLAIVLFILFGWLMVRKNTAANPSSKSTTESTNIGPAKKSLAINRDFYFPIKDRENNDVSHIKYTIEKAEKRDTIVVQGKTATAIKGRTFLILILKVTNTLDSDIEINTRDYVRLVVNGNNGEQFAPDIHNDPVTVQAISTKQTRLGFPVNDSDTGLVLQIGEIKGNKESLPLDFK